MSFCLCSVLDVQAMCLLTARMSVQGKYMQRNPILAVSDVNQCQTAQNAQPGPSPRDTLSE